VRDPRGHHLAALRTHPHRYRDLMEPEPVHFFRLRAAPRQRNGGRDRSTSRPFDSRTSPADAKRMRRGVRIILP
jgi:hypothetical protein